MADALERGEMRVRGFADSEMEYQLIRQLGATRYGGASIGECLTLAQNIKDGDPASWVSHFVQAATRQQADAEQRASRGHAVSAHDGFLLASNSWRAAEYYTLIGDPRHLEYGLASRKCFLQAMQAGGVACEALFLPHGEMQLPAYYMRPSQNRTRPNKTLMIISGYDGTLEETYLAYGKAALERGYALLLFTGPGQMDTLRFYPGLQFIPEFEHIGMAAVDELLSRKETDPQRIALMGISFGGYFATRIAVHEPRIRALIANSPILDLHAYMTSFAGFDPVQMPAADDFQLDEIPQIPDDIMPPQTKKMAANLMQRVGGGSFSGSYRRLQDFHIDDHELASLQCAALALVGEGEGREPLRQYTHFLATVPAASGHVFGAQEGAEGHCQSGNLAYSAAVSMDWLDEVFA